MTSKKRTISILLTAVLALSLLLTACGNGGDTPTGDNSTPGVSETVTSEGRTGGEDATTPGNDDINTPETSPDYTEPEIAAVIPMAGEGEGDGTVSVAGTYYQGDQFSYSLPDGLSCRVYQESINGDCFATLWTKDWSPVPLDTGRVVTITEYYEKVTDFETRTAEQWYLYCYGGQEVDSSIKDLAVEKTFVDGCPAIRLTNKTEIGAESSFDEAWAVDAPNGSIVCFFVNIELWENQDDYSKWVEDIISTFRVNK